MPEDISGIDTRKKRLSCRQSGWLDTASCQWPSGDVFGDELFIRKSNGFIPTPTAERLGQKVDQVLADFEDLLSSDSFEPSSVASMQVSL